MCNSWLFPTLKGQTKSIFVVHSTARWRVKVVLHLFDLTLALRYCPVWVHPWHANSYTQNAIKRGCLLILRSRHFHSELNPSPSFKTLMWSGTHGSHSHRFILLFCVLNRSSVLSSLGSPIPLLTHSPGALLGPAHHPHPLSCVLPLSCLRGPPSRRMAYPMSLHVPVVYPQTPRKRP